MTINYAGRVRRSPEGCLWAHNSPSVPFRPLSHGISTRPSTPSSPQGQRTARHDNDVDEALTPALIEHVHGRDLDVAVVTNGPMGAGCQPA